MARGRLGRHGPLSGLTLLAGLGYFVIAYGAILLSREGEVAPVWPCAALAICVLLRQCGTLKDAAWPLAAIFLAGLPANHFGGSPALLTFVFSLNNVLEITLAFVLARRFTPKRFLSVASGAKFMVVVGLIPPLLGGTVAGTVTALMGDVSGAWQAAGTWYIADALGFFIIAPFAMSISMRELKRLRLAGRVPEAALVMLAVAAVSVFVFFQKAPLLFLIPPVCLYATYRFRVIGAGAATIIISIVAMMAIGMKSGLLWHFAIDPATQMQIVQIFLAVCILTSVPAAAFLNVRAMHLASIEKRRQRALAASRFKSRLLSHVSHEVRGPLSAIIGWSSMLESGVLRQEDAGDYAHIVARNGELLLRLHDDILDMQRAEAGELQVNPESVDIAPALKSIVTVMKPTQYDTGTAKVMIGEVDDTLALRADPVRLAQILNNLIGNAQKYSTGMEPVTVSARRLNSGFGRIEIRNHGPGIAPEQRARVFQPFTRLSPQGKDMGGAGLGLSIAKMLVELQGGRIDFESEPDQQTKFWIDLPLAA